MTVKTLKKQLAAAIAMVLVSVIALSSSTYAWFASNNKVQATGMQVQAVAEGGIEIAYVADTTPGSYATSATANMGAAQVLYPTSTLATATGDAITSSWYHASALAVNAHTAKSGTYETLELNANGADGTGEDAHQYYLKKTFNIRSVSATKNATNLKVKNITVTSSAQALSGSLRIAVVNNGTVALYAPVGYSRSGEEAGVAYNVATSVAANGNATGTTEMTALYATDESAVLASSVTSAGDDVVIYIWFEGEDDNHTTNNLNAAGTLENISISVDFVAEI